MKKQIMDNTFQAIRLIMVFVAIIYLSYNYFELDQDVSNWSLMMVILIALSIFHHGE